MAGEYDGRDGRELDTLAISTRAAVKERIGVEYGAPLRGYLHRLDGEVIELGFLSVADVGEFITLMNPREIILHVGARECEGTLRAAIDAAAAGGRLH